LAAPRLVEPARLHLRAGPRRDPNVLPGGRDDELLDPLQLRRVGDLASAHVEVAKASLPPDAPPAAPPLHEPASLRGAAAVIPSGKEPLSERAAECFEGAVREEDETDELDRRPQRLAHRRDRDPRGALAGLAGDPGRGA